MKASRIKNTITYLLLVLFLSMKMIGLHTLSHSHDEDHALHCVVCDNAIANNFTPVLAPSIESFTIENTEFTIQSEVAKNYSFITSNTIESDQLFSRPPPLLL